MPIYQSKFSFCFGQSDVGAVVQEKEISADSPADYLRDLACNHAASFLNAATDLSTLHTALVLAKATADMLGIPLEYVFTYSALSLYNLPIFADRPFDLRQLPPRSMSWDKTCAIQETEDGNFVIVDR